MTPRPQLLGFRKAVALLDGGPQALRGIGVCVGQALGRVDELFAIGFIIGRRIVAFEETLRVGLRLLPGRGRLDMLLVDAKPAPGAVLPGGNGLAFDWRLIAGRRWPVPWMLAVLADPEQGLLLMAADRTTTLLVSGTGEVLSPDDNVVAVGSGVSSMPGTRIWKRTVEA